MTKIASLNLYSSENHSEFRRSLTKRSLLSLHSMHRYNFGTETDLRDLRYSERLWRIPLSARIFCLSAHILLDHDAYEASRLSNHPRPARESFMGYAP